MSQSANTTNANKHDEKIVAILGRVGIVNASKIADTLQGSIWRATVSPANNSDDDAKSISTSHDGSSVNVVVKVADQSLLKQGLAQIGTHRVKCDENILSEAKIMQTITANKDCPPSIVKFSRLLKTATDYYLIMEDGGSSLFEFVVKAHALMLRGKIEVSHWRKVSKIIFKQMLQSIEYLHAQNICHLDVSLENFLINDVQVVVTSVADTDVEHIEFVTDDIQIKLCDFGLAERFKSDKCLCSKFCGKRNYKSPEVVAMNARFNAKKNDIWCLGVCLFMLSFGTAPWESASPKDAGFNYIMNGSLNLVLKAWGMQHYATDKLIDLLQSVFQTEATRISVHGVQSHAWLKC